MEEKPKPSTIERYVPILEKFFIFSLVIGIGLNSLNTTFLPIISISLSSLALIFYLYTQVPNNIPKPEEGFLFGFIELLSYTIIPKVLWISTAILTVGILFYTLDLDEKGYLSMLGIGITTVIIGSLVLITNLAIGTKHISYVIPVLYRSTPALIIGIYILQSR